MEERKQQYCNIYVIQQIHNVLWLRLFITVGGSTCFGPQWSIFRSVYKLYVWNLVCGILRTTRYVQMLCGYRKNIQLEQRSWGRAIQVRNMSSHQLLWINSITKHCVSVGLHIYCKMTHGPYNTKWLLPSSFLSFCHFVRLSVCLSVWSNRVSAGRIFMKFDKGFYCNLLTTLQLGQNVTKRTHTHLKWRRTVTCDVTPTVTSRVHDVHLKI